MNQASLFDPRYPEIPGAKREGTSRRAAQAMRSSAPTIRDQILALLKDAALTPDEAAAKLGKSVLACRPRFSELLGMNKIYDTGRRRKNESGLNAVVWRAK